MSESRVRCGSSGNIRPTREPFPELPGSWQWTIGRKMNCLHAHTYTYTKGRVLLMWATILVWPEIGTGIFWLWIEYDVFKYSSKLLLLLILLAILLSSSGPGPGPDQVQIRSRSGRSEIDLSLTLFLVCTHPPTHHPPPQTFFLAFKGSRHVRWT